MAQQQRGFIQIKDVVKVFNTPAGDFPALQGVTLDFDKGDFVSVVGKSGSGKSTLVNMLTGIDHPTSGDVQIEDTHIHRLSESQMARWRGRNLGIVFQFYQLLPMLSLLENTVLPMDFCDMYDPSARQERAMSLLDTVGLADVAHKMPSEVSGGQQQSAAIARALANDPPLIVADEPTGNLDSRAADKVYHLFEDLAVQGKTIIMVTHDESLAHRAGRRVLLVDGEVIDEIVLRALPLLNHQQMLTATKRVQSKQFAPGETIVAQGERNDLFYMIAQGYTNVIIQPPQGREVSIAQLGPGQHFGEVELLNEHSTAIATIKAAIHSAVKVLTLDRDSFAHLMAEAHNMRDHLYQLVTERVTQNRTLDLGSRGDLYGQSAMA